MTIQILNDFHGDGVFRDQQGAIWVRQSEMDEGMARAWDEGARWAAVECGAIDDERQAWIAPGENPYTKGEQK